MLVLELGSTLWALRSGKKRVLQHVGLCEMGVILRNGLPVDANVCFWRSASYVGCNTWDLMDKARYPEYHDEIQNRLDSMVKARSPSRLLSVCVCGLLRACVLVCMLGVKQRVLMR